MGVRGCASQDTPYWGTQAWPSSPPGPGIHEPVLCAFTCSGHFTEVGSHTIWPSVYGASPSTVCFQGLRVVRVRAPLFLVRDALCVSGRVCPSIRGHLGGSYLPAVDGTAVSMHVVQVFI